MPAGTSGFLSRAIMGHLPELRAGPVDFIERSAGDHGHWVPLRFGPLPAVLVAHRSAIQTILEDATGFGRLRQMRLTHRFFGDALGTSDGARWERHRELVEPFLLEEHLRSRAAVGWEPVERWLSALADGEVRDVAAELQALGMQMLAAVLFDAQLSDDDVVPLERAYTEGLGELHGLATGPLQLVPQLVPVPANRRLAAARGTVHGIVDRLVEERGGDDLLSRLLAAGLSAPEVRDLAVQLLQTAREFGMTVAWALYLLDRHQEERAELETEVDTVLGGGAPAWEDLPRLATTRLVIQETLRLYPATPLLGRRALRTRTVAGRRVRRGTMLFLSPWLVQRDPALYEDPEAFRPQRWAQGLEARLPPCAFLPFGGGARACLGPSFVRAHAPRVLSAVAARYRFVLASEGPVRMAASFNARPADGLVMVVHRRPAR